MHIHSNNINNVIIINMSRDRTKIVYCKSLRLLFLGFTTYNFFKINWKKDTFICIIIIHTSTHVHALFFVIVYSVYVY